MTSGAFGKARSGRILGIFIGFFGLALVAWAFRADDDWYEIHMLPRFCAAEPAELAHAHLARGVVAVLGVLLLFFVRPWAAKKLAGRRPSIGVVVALVMAVVAAEGILRVAQTRRERSRPPPAQGPTNEPRKTVTAFVGDRAVQYASNDEGFRTKTDDVVVDHAVPTILFAGESDVYGYGLEYDETIPALVEANTGVSTVNLGVSAFSSDQILGRIQYWLPRFEHPKAVVTFVLYNLLARALDDQRERLVIGRSGTLEMVPPTPTWLETSPLRRAFRASYHADDVVELTRAVLHETDAYVRSRGAFSLFVFTQSGDRCFANGATPRIVDRLREGLELHAIDVDIDPSLVTVNDIHPNPRGAIVYATAIERALREGGAL